MGSTPGQGSRTGTRQVEEVRAWTVLGSGLHTFVVGDGQARSPKKGPGSEWGFGQVAKAKVSRGLTGPSTWLGRGGFSW